MQGSALNAAFDAISDLAPDIQDDIMSDVTLEVLQHGMPTDLQRLVKTFKEKNLNMYVKRTDEVSMSLLPTTDFGDNKATRIVDEQTETPFEDRPVYIID